MGAEESGSSGYETRRHGCAEYLCTRPSLRSNRPRNRRSLMAATRFVERLNEQIAYEFAASQQYIANAAYYDGETLPRLAAFFYAQALEERNHAMMMVQYLLDADERVAVPGI